MAARRSLHKKISLCEQLADVSQLACLAFTWAIPHADDFGTIHGSPRHFRAEVFPLRDLTIGQVAAALAELIAAGLLIGYEVKGISYLHFPAWDAHQDIRKRTTMRSLPLPETSGNLPELPGNGERDIDERQTETQTETTVARGHGETEEAGTSGNFRELPASRAPAEVKRSEVKVRQDSPPLPPSHDGKATAGERDSDKQPTEGTSSTQHFEVGVLLGQHVNGLRHNRSRWNTVLADALERGEFTLNELEARLVEDTPKTGDFKNVEGWVRRWEGHKRKLAFQSEKVAESTEKLTPAQIKQRKIDEKVRLKLEEARNIG